MMFRAWRPCGACDELVRADDGCEHWRPGLSPKAADSRERRRVVNERLAEFRRMMRLGET
jgi:hypothetical protein